MARFIALHCTDQTSVLIVRHPSAFLLLTQIAMRAKWKDCAISGMKAGEAFIGDWQEAGLHSRQAYRHAKDVLERNHLATFRGTNKGTIATLSNSMIYSISTPTEEPSNNQQGNHPTTTNHTDTQNTQSTSRKKKAQKQGRVRENTPQMIQIGGWFGRRPDTLWTTEEAEALASANPKQNEIDGMGTYYDATIHPDKDFRCRAVITLINNWNRELDRARQHYKSKHP